MDRPVPSDMFGTPVPDPQRWEHPVSEPDSIDPPGGYAAMPPAAPDPVEGSTAPMTGDVPPMQTPSAAHRFDPWSDRADIGDGSRLIGDRVEAIDGRIGKIDEASTLVDNEHLVVATGPWIFGKKVLVPAGAVRNVDEAAHRVYLDQTKDQIRHAPEYDPDAVQ